MACAPMFPAGGMSGALQPSIPVQSLIHCHGKGSCFLLRLPCLLISCVRSEGCPFLWVVHLSQSPQDNCWQVALLSGFTLSSNPGFHESAPLQNQLCWETLSPQNCEAQACSFLHYPSCLLPCACRTQSPHNTHIQPWIHTHKHAQFTHTYIIHTYNITHIQMHTHIHTCTHIHTQVHTYTHMHLHINTHTQVHTHACTHSYTHSHTKLRTFPSVHWWKPVCPW